MSRPVVAAARMIERCLRDGGKVMFCGNGGSAADAQHLAAELMGRFLVDRAPMAAVALTVDTSALTAIGNDYGFDEVFARQVRGLARRRRRAGRHLHQRQQRQCHRGIRDRAQRCGVRTIALTGGGGGRMATLADLLINAPSLSTPRIQELHIAIGHTICELVEDALPHERRRCGGDAGGDPGRRARHAARRGDRCIARSRWSMWADGRFSTHLIANLARHGFTDIVLLAGYLAEQFEALEARAPELGCRIRCLVEPSPAGTAGALLHAREPSRRAVPAAQRRQPVRHQLSRSLRAGHRPRRSPLGVMALRRMADTGRYGRVELSGGAITISPRRARGGPGLINGGIYWLGAPCWTGSATSRPRWNRTCCRASPRPGVLAAGAMTASSSTSASPKIWRARKRDPGADAPPRRISRPGRRAQYRQRLCA